MNKSKRNKYIAIAIIAAIVIGILIPSTYYVGSIPSGRYVSSAVIEDVDKSRNLIQVQLISNEKKTDTFLTLEGNLPSDCRIGQSVKIGYRSSGLYENTSQTIDAAFETKSNMILGLIHYIAPLETVYGLKIVNVQSDGTLLEYYIAS